MQIYAVSITIRIVVSELAALEYISTLDVIIDEISLGDWSNNILTIFYIFDMLAAWFHVTGSHMEV